MPLEPVGRPSIVARGELSCGQVMLTQTFTGTADPYYVLFYFLPKGAKEWIEFYVDDESPYWRGSLRVSPNREACSVTFYGRQDLAYRCGDSTLQREKRVASLPRALVQDPLGRNYQELLDATKAKASLEQHSWSHAAK